MKNVRKNLFSEKGMTAVNALFLLSLLLRDSGVIFIAYLVWIAYLALCMRHTQAKGGRIVYSALMGLAAIMVCLNLYFLLRG